MPERAEMITTPEAMPVTVPLLSTLATATLFEVQEIRTVGMTLPLRSNAVAMSPERSPTFTVTDEGATWTSATFWATSAPGRARVSATRVRGVMASERKSL